MGSRKFFYFLAAPGGHLDVCNAAHILSDEGLTFESPAFLVSLDEDGVLLAAREQHLKCPAPAHICRLLAAGDNVDVTCNDKSLSLTCGFGSPHGDLIFSIHVSRKAWSRVDQSVRSNYERIFARVAKETHAQNVIIIDDPADDFYGNIARIDDQWVVDMRLWDGTEYDASVVWGNAATEAPSGMRALRSTGRRIGGFEEFEEQLKVLLIKKSS